MAEAEGFEPPVGCPTSVFKTGAFSQALPRLRTAGAAGAVWRGQGHGLADEHNGWALAELAEVLGSADGD